MMGDVVRTISPQQVWGAAHQTWLASNNGLFAVQEHAMGVWRQDSASKIAMSVDEDKFNS